MKKEDLRPIEYNSIKPKKGYFHHWLIKKNDDGSDFTIAFIEAEDGTTQEIHPTSIRFMD